MIFLLRMSFFGLSVLSFFFLFGGSAPLFKGFFMPFLAALAPGSPFALIALLIRPPAPLFSVLFLLVLCARPLRTLSFVLCERQILARRSSERLRVCDFWALALFGAPSSLHHAPLLAGIP